VIQRNRLCHTLYLMNQKARMLGLHQSTFKNPHELDAKDHLSSAYDLAVSTRHALTILGFIGISSDRAYQSEASTYPWLNKNKLVKYQAEATLLEKTGYTTSAGRTLMTVFQKQHQPIIVVTLNAPNDWTDHQTLFQQAEIKKEPALRERGLFPFLGVRVCP